jgi:hypothetical protein
MSLIFILVVFVFSACQEPMDYEYDQILKPVLLVEGKISTDTTNHYVILSQTVSLSNSAQVWVTNAKVTISSESEVYTLTEDSAGHYYTEPDVFGLIGETYTLNILLDNGEEYTATTSIQDIPEIDSVKFLYEEFENYDIYFHNLYYHGWELEEEGNAYLWNLYMNDTLYNDTIWKTNFVNDDFVNGKYIGINKYTGESDFPIYQLQPHEITTDTAYILVEMESVPQLYYDFFMTFLQQTVFVGSPFDATKADPSNNISNGGIGYFYGASIKRYSFVYIRLEESKNVDQERF